MMSRLHPQQLLLLLLLQEPHLQVDIKCCITSSVLLSHVVTVMMIYSL